MIIVCDVDGTISDHNHRFPYVNGSQKKDFKKYYQLMGQDTPFPGALVALRNLVRVAYPNFYFLTGRPEEYRDLTQRWIFDNYSISCMPPTYGVQSANQAHLLMRSDGDYRPAVVFKEECIRRLYEGAVGMTHRYPMLFLDDDLRNADMYRRYGIFLRAPECWTVMP
jgi:hypothetical protein